MMKLIFALESRRLLGAHIIGEGATELIHIDQAVLNLGGTVDYFVENAFNDPTLAEAYKIAALDATTACAERQAFTGLRRSCSKVAMNTPAATNPMMMVASALTSGATPRRTLE